MNSNTGVLRRNSSFIASIAVAATLVTGCAGGALTTRDRFEEAEQVIRQGMALRAKFVAELRRPDYTRLMTVLHALFAGEDAATEGKKVITGMLIVGLVFLAVIACGETMHWLRHRHR